MAAYPFTQADETPELDAIANDYGELAAEKKVLEARLKKLQGAGHIWLAGKGAVGEGCTQIDDIDNRLKALVIDYEGAYFQLVGKGD
jgi:hypothetical protein